jgi:tetratricopeptide (TPR) repeat protein
LSLPLLALSWGLSHSLDRSRVTRGVVAAVIAILAIVNVHHQAVWHDDVSLWTAASENEPHAFYAWLQLGHAKRDAGDFAGSIDAYEHAIVAQPKLSLGHSALFFAVVQKEAPSEAKRLFASYQAALRQPQLFDGLASELIRLDARNSAALVFRRMSDSGLLDAESRRLMIAAARSSPTPWVARAIEAEHPASDDLR